MYGNEELKNGCSKKMVAALVAGMDLGYRVEKDDGYGGPITWITLGDDSEIRAARAAWDKKTEKLWCSERQASLIQNQINGYGCANRPRGLSLGSNIYGYSINDTMGANMGGGRSSVTARGLTLSQAICAGVAMLGTPNHTLRFAASSLPVEVQAILPGV